MSTNYEDSDDENNFEDFQDNSDDEVIVKGSQEGDDEDEEDEDSVEDSGDEEDDESDDGEAEEEEEQEEDEEDELQKQEELKEKANELLRKIQGNKDQPTEEEIHKVMHLPIISHPQTKNQIYRNTYLFYASNAPMYSSMKTYLDYHDGTLDIREFEKTCSLPKQNGSELVRICEEREKNRRKKEFNSSHGNKSSSKSGNSKSKKVDPSPKIKDVSISIDSLKDVRNSNAHQNFKQSMELCSAVNSKEFYDDMAKDFIQNLNQDVKVDPKLDAPFELQRKMLPEGSETGARGQGTDLFGDMEQESNQATPQNNLEAFMFGQDKSPFGASPGHSDGNNPFESFHSVNFADSFKGNGNNNNSSKGGGTQGNGSVSGTFNDRGSSVGGGENPFMWNLFTPGFRTENYKNYNTSKELKDQQMKLEHPLLKIEKLEEEGTISSKFNIFCQKRWEAGKRGTGATSKLDPRAAQASISIFKYQNIKVSDEASDSSKMIKKRRAEEVFFDYSTTSMPESHKLVKSEEDFNYFNRDLVYSTWHDQLSKSMQMEPEEAGFENSEQSLMIDLNDKAVIYSKLRDTLKQKKVIKDKIIGHKSLDFSKLPLNLPMSDPKWAAILQKEGGNFKRVLKMFTKHQKDLRIMFVKLTRDPEALKKITKKLASEGDSSFINFLKAQRQGGAMGMRRVQKKNRRKITNYIHSRLANDFTFNVLNMSPSLTYRLHRHDISRTIIGDILKQRLCSWRTKIVNSHKANYPIKVKMSRRRNLVDANQKEIHQSYEIFKKHKNISLKSDEFVLFEYIEQDPLIIGNPGMASRLTRYYYADTVAHRTKSELGQQASKQDVIDRFKKVVDRDLGPLGEEIVLEKEEKLPILGQLNRNSVSAKDQHIGLTIMENNMYKLPVFKQKPKKTDFVLVRVVEKGKCKYYLRRIKHVYVTGQIQPKLEVYCPYSRQYNSFLKKLLKFYIKKCFERYQQVNLNEVKEILPKMNEHNIRKNIKLLGGEQDPVMPKVYNFNPEILKENKANDYADELEAAVTPEELCLYERMHQSQDQLKDFGIDTLKSSDKISMIKTKFYRQNLLDPRKCVIARRIIEELYLSAWNLSNCFFDAVQRQGRMYLNGYGDPTHGHGGINYIKLPLKISRYESQLFRKAKKGKPQPMVTGTEADLRRLGMKFVHRKLKEHGYKEEDLAKLERWDRIDLLRGIANKQIQDGGEADPELFKFSRNIRMTTKKQKEKYQNDINQLLNKLINTLSRQDDEEIESDDEMDLVEDFGKLVQREKKELEKYKHLTNEEDDPNKYGSDSASDIQSEVRSQVAVGDIRFEDQSC